MSLSSTLRGGLLAVALIMTPAVASAQSAQLAAARALANAGRELFDKGDFQGAMQRFQSAEKIHHALPHLLYIARAQEKLGKLLDARATYRKLVEETLPEDAPKPFFAAQETGKEELAALDERIPRLAISLVGATGAAVKVDGAKVDPASPVLVEPGEHQVEARADGYRPARKTVTVTAEDRQVQVSLELAKIPEEKPPPPPPPPPPPSLLPPIVVMGAGGASLLVGAITGGLALSKASELREACPQNPCPTAHQSLADGAHALATVSTATLIAGGLLAAGGATWLVLGLTSKPDEADSAWARPYVRLSDQLATAGVAGVF